VQIEQLRAGRFERVDGTACLVGFDGAPELFFASADRRKRKFALLGTIARQL